MNKPSKDCAIWGMMMALAATRYLGIAVVLVIVLSGLSEIQRRQSMLAG